MKKRDSSKLLLSLFWLLILLPMRLSRVCTCMSIPQEYDLLNVWLGQFGKPNLMKWFSLGPPSARVAQLKLIERAREWNEAVRELEIDDRWVDRIAFTWIRLHLSWLLKGDEQLPVPLELGSDIDKAWSQLIQFVERDSNRLSSQWFKAGLPLLTAPEYGLSNEIQRQLFDALFSENLMFGTPYEEKLFANQDDVSEDRRRKIGSRFINYQELESRR